MAIVGGNLEKKEIGLDIGVSGTHSNTEIDSTTGFLRLTQSDVDGSGNPIYSAEGKWISDVINLGDVFQDFEKVFTTNIVSGNSSHAVFTRVSSNGLDWTNWISIAMDGTIQSEVKQYIQVRIDLFAGFITDEFSIDKVDYTNGNEFVERIKLNEDKWEVPNLTSNTSSSIGFSFSETEAGASFSSWKAFDGIYNIDVGYLTKNLTFTGYIGFYFNSEVKINKYKIGSGGNSNYTSALPQQWTLQGSNNTTNGLDGTWIDLDSREGQSWNTINKEVEFTFKNNSKFKAYRLFLKKNNGHPNYIGVGSLNFFSNNETIMKLKRNYAYGMKQELTWVDTGSLHKKKIKRSDWLRVDSLQVAEKVT